MSGLCAVNECTSLCSFLSVKGTLCKISLAHVDFGLVSLNCGDTSRVFIFYNWLFLSKYSRYSMKTTSTFPINNILLLGIPCHKSAASYDIYLTRYNKNQ